MNYPKYGCPFKRGSNYFYYMNTGLQNQSVLYIQDSLTAEPRVFLDPNVLSADGTTAISTTAFSENGEWFAYALSDAGSDWVRIKIRNVVTGEDVDETLHKAKFTGITWTHDNLGFFYSYYPEHGTKADGTETVSNANQKLYYHRINTDQSEDVLAVEFPEEPKWRSGGCVSDDGKYLHVFVREGCQDNLWYYAKLDGKPIQGKLDLTPIVTKYEAEYDYVNNDGDIVYMKTNKDAPNYRVIKVDLKRPEPVSVLDIHLKASLTNFIFSLRNSGQLDRPGA